MFEYGAKFSRYTGLRAGQCLDIILDYKPRTVIDVGSGPGKHAEVMRKAGIDVTTISLSPPADYVCDYLDYTGGAADIVWASHILEHVQNVGEFIQWCKLYALEKIAITVPPAKSEFVAGHINLFTAPTFCYTLIVSGLKIERFGCYGYNMSAICSADKNPIDMSAPFDEVVSRMPFNAQHGFDSAPKNYKWP